METDLLSTREGENQFLDALYGDNVQTKEATTVRKSKSIVRIIELSKSLNGLLKDHDIYIIRRALASCDSDSLSLFDRETEKLIGIRGSLRGILKGFGWNERA